MQVLRLHICASEIRFELGTKYTYPLCDGHPVLAESHEATAAEKCLFVRALLSLLDEPVEGLRNCCRHGRAALGSVVIVVRAFNVVDVGIGELRGLTPEYARVESRRAGVSQAQDAVLPNSIHNCSHLGRAIVQE